MAAKQTDEPTLPSVPPAGSRSGSSTSAADSLPGASRTPAILLRLEQEARAAATPEALGFTAVNRSRTLLSYDHAALVLLSGRRVRIAALSNLPIVDRNAPYSVWLRKALRHLSRKGILSEPRVLNQDDLPEPLKDGAEEWWQPYVYWAPFTRPGMPVFGGLLLMRSRPAWTEAEKVLLESLADCYGHAWWALTAKGGAGRRPIRTAATVAILAGLAAAMAIPVPRSVVAPARIVANNPIVVTAPMDGVIEEIEVAPNQPIAAGDLLFRYAAEELEANLAVAEQAVAAAEADLRRVQQQAFGDPGSKAEIELKQATLDLKEIERDFGRFLVSQIRVTADGAGIAVISAPEEWQGRPVQTGIQVMRIADPADVKVEIDIPVGDAIATDPGAPVSLFLDIDPLHPLDGMLERASYLAEEAEGGVLAYRATAELQLSGDAVPPRIGLRGTARISGAPVPLGLFLFRRPIAAVRQFLGL